ncbi:hypothetical protein [Paenibacillus sp. TH7-28]
MGREDSGTKGRYFAREEGSAQITEFFTVIYGRRKPESAFFHDWWKIGTKNASIPPERGKIC